MKRFFRLAVAASLLVMALACSKKSEPFIFVQISDPQMGFKEKGTIERSVGLLDKAVEAINRLQPAFVLVTGDMLNHWNSEEEFNAYKAGIAAIDKGIRVYEVPGNHDFRPVTEPESEPAYFERFGTDRHEFWYKGSYFLGFNSNYIKDGNIEKETAQYEWMVSCLEKNAKKADHVFLFTHCSIIRESVDEEEDYFNFQSPYREKYLKLCKDYDVDMVLSGHYHRQRRVFYDGTMHVTCTASGWPLGDGVSGINVVEVRPEGFSWAINPAEKAGRP